MGCPALILAVILGPTGPIENPSPELLAQFEEFDRERAELEALWWQEARALAETNEGTRHLLAAMEGMRDIVDLFFELQGPANQGWDRFQPEIAQIIGQHADALDSAVAASEGGSIALPAPRDPPGMHSQPFPDEWELVIYLMANESHRLAWIDRPDMAATRALQAIRLSALFQVEGTDLLLRSRGVGGLKYGLVPLVSAVRHPDISPESVQYVDDTLANVVEGWTGYGTTLRSLHNRSLESYRDAAEDPEARAELYQQTDPSYVRELHDYTETMRESYDLDDSMQDHEWPTLEYSLAVARVSRQGYDEIFSDFPAFEANDVIVAEAIAENADHPFWQRSFVNRDWLSQHTHYIHWLGANEVRPFGRFMCNYFPLQEDLLIARAQLIRALCRLRLGDVEGFSGVIDPFTGEPFRRDDEKIWGPGPDGVDQGGEAELERTPFAGVFGDYEHPSGDIVLHLTE